LKTLGVASAWDEFLEVPLRGRAAGSEFRLEGAQEQLKVRQ
jgi:hypothetical protein